MNKVMIDTHVLWWWLEASPKLSKEHFEIIENGNTYVSVSVCSLFEMYIKASLKKLRIVDNLETIIKESDIEIIPIKFPHLEIYKTLPFYHRDPFDRMIISQAISENLQLVSYDSNFPAYDVRLI